MRFTTTIRTWRAEGGVEGVFDPLAATWEERFTASALAEPLGDSAIRTLFDDMRAEGMRFWLDNSHPEIGFRWLIRDEGTGLFYLVEPSAPRLYDTGIRHTEINARRLAEGPTDI